MNSIKLAEYNIILSENVIEIFKKRIQNTFLKREAGGILLGQIKDNNIYILRASIPTMYDKATRTTFHRSKEIAQILIDYEFENTDRKTIYLGEWHTHPERVPTPSSQDEKMIKEQMKLNKLNEDFILLMIQGIEKLYVSIYKDEMFYDCVV